jgi:hypothetical protein
MQDCQKKPQNSLSPLGFNMFLSTIQHGQQLSKIPSQDSAMGEESYEMSNQYTSGTSLYIILIDYLRNF